MKGLNYSKGIHVVLKQVHYDLQITNAALLMINNMLISLGIRLIKASNKISNLLNNKLLSKADMATAVKILLGDDLSRFALSEGTKAVAKYKESRMRIKRKMAKEKYAGLQFKVSTTNSLIHKNINKNNSSYEDTGVFLTAVLEYISAELLESSGDTARDDGRKQITPRDILKAVKDDSELDQIYSGYILGTGVIPAINDKLLQLKGGAPNFQNKDSINGITKPGLQRLMYRAGVKYISGLVYEESRYILKQFLIKIVFNSIAIAERKKHTTVMYEDGIEALNLLNISIYNTKGYPGTMSPCKGSEKVSKLFPKKEVNKKRKRKPKTNLLRIIKIYQKTSCTLLPHASVDLLIRDIGNDLNKNITRYELNYMWLIHATIEDYMVKLYKNAILIALHSNRLTLMPKDIRLVQTITNM